MPLHMGIIPKMSAFFRSRFVPSGRGTVWSRLPGTTGSSANPFASFAVLACSWVITTSFLPTCHRARGISGPRPGTEHTRPLTAQQAHEHCSRLLPPQARTHAAGTDAAGAGLQHDSNANVTGGAGECRPREPAMLRHPLTRPPAGAREPGPQRSRSSCVQTPRRLSQQLQERLPRPPVPRSGPPRRRV
jgi:hypothetical protein